jgi:hypothetical protein
MTTEQYDSLYLTLANAYLESDHGYLDRINGSLETWNEFYEQLLRQYSSLGRHLANLGRDLAYLHRYLVKRGLTPESTPELLVLLHEYDELVEEAFARGYYNYEGVPEPPPECS